MPSYPYTPTRGRLKGQTFNTAAEYVTALNNAGGSGDALPRGRSGKSRGSNGVKPGMVRGLLKAVNWGLSAFPATRDDALQDAEIEALVNSALELASVNKAFANVIIKWTTVNAQTQMAMVCTAVLSRRVVPRLVQTEYVNSDTNETTVKGVIPLPVAMMMEGVAVTLIQAVASGDTFNVGAGEQEQPPDVVSPNGHSPTPDDVPELVIDLAAR